VLCDRNIIGTSSEIFGYLRQSSENVRRCSPSLRNNFGKSSEVFGKFSEIFGKSSKTSLLVCLYNKQNNTWTLGDMEFIFSCSHSISHSFASLTRSISMWTLEDKFHISARPCIILYEFHICKQFNFLLNRTFMIVVANRYTKWRYHRRCRNMTLRHTPGLMKVAILMSARNVKRQTNLIKSFSFLRGEEGFSEECETLPPRPPQKMNR